MLRLLLCAGITAGGAALSGAPAPSAGLPPTTPLAYPLPVEDPVLPPTLPGYELRVLDLRKQLVFNVNGTQVRASLPIFFYYPVALPDRAAGLVRQAYHKLIDLGGKPEWSAAELREVIAELGAAIELLEKRRP